VNAELSENNQAEAAAAETATAGTAQWEFIDSGFNTGRFNMDFDLELVERCKNENISFLRFYRWKPYAISLGYNQTKFTSGHKIDTEKCKTDGIDIVDRPTGGRAVLHSEELTYSVITKSDDAVHEMYRKISLALLNGLKLIEPENTELQELSFTKEMPDLLKLAKTGMYNLCFNTSIKNEINCKGKKLVGSAQRKFSGIVLQHGSVLIGKHHENIVSYLLTDEKVKDKLKKEIEQKTTCLNDILKRTVSYEETASALLKGFEKTLNISFK
jgi:lipoate-protein ligase A